MRRLSTWVIGFLFSVSTAAHAVPLPLKGSDTLEQVTKDVISLCSLGALISYIGGGSGTGQAAMTAGTQQMAPMSRELNGTACTATAGQLLIGLDGISILTSNQLFGDSIDQTTDLTDNCSDTIDGGLSLAVPGCTVADGCDASGNYLFADWKDVMAVLYGGQNHTTATQLLATGLRNPARINCASTVRQALVNNWTAVFRDSLLDPQPCRATDCLRLKHAFRRGDQSGTTDTFVTLVGLLAIPPYTTASASNLPVVDASATPNPFCNAGEAKMNKGDADYLDLDPLRRIVDSDLAANGRLGFEQVAQGYQAPSNPPLNQFIDDRVEPPAAVMADYSNSSEANILPDPSITNSAALQKAALLTRKGLGVVLPIEVPGNFLDERVAYYSTVALSGEPVLCTPGKYAPSIADTRHPSTALCPNGKNQPCLLPVNTDTAPVNFNCLTNAPVPVAAPLRDARVYNLLVVDTTGHYVRDNYINPNLTLSATIQARVISAFYRLHISQVTNLGAPAPGINCKKFTSTEQIGCLVAASPCSIGFAGREAVDNALNIAMQVAGIKATAPNVENLVNGSGGPIYPLSRRLWVNALNGFSSVTGDQQSLLRCFQGLTPGVPLSDIDLVVQHRNFVRVPAGVSRTKACPAVFP
jgi:ABC-type phosphate transport system substrate-binding protein